MKCEVCEKRVESVWVDYEVGDKLCTDCLDERYEGDW